MLVEVGALVIGCVVRWVCMDLVVMGDDVKGIDSED